MAARLDTQPHPAPPIGRPGRSARRRLGRDVWCYVFMAPALVLYVGFMFWPTLASFIYSFYNWSGLGQPSAFVGLRNYNDLIADKYFWNAFKNTLVFMLGVVPIQVSLALVLAAMLNNERLLGRNFYRSLYFLPTVTSTAIIGIILVYVFSAYQGPVNLMLMGLGVVDRPIDFLGQPALAMATLIGVGVWKGLGTNMVYWLAGLSSIPGELYEAAHVDGANALQRFRHITVPLLVPTGMVVLLLAVVANLKVFDMVKTLTDGGPFFATDVIMTYIYRHAFSTEIGLPRLGYASAAAVFFGLLMVAVGVVQSLGVRVAGRTDRARPGRGGGPDA